METLLELLVPLVQLVSSGVLVVLFFVFIVRPLLDYFIVNREIERRKRINEESAMALGPMADSYRSLEDNASLAQGSGVGEEVQQQFGKEPQALNSSAPTDADKAANMVKQWVDTDRKK